MFDRVLASLLDTAAEAARALASKDVRPKAPLLFLLSALASSALAANDLFAALVDIPLGIYLIVKGGFGKALLTLLFFDAVVSAPLLLSDPMRALDFVVRSFSSSSVFIFIISLTGWEGFVNSLPVSDEVKLMIKLIPLQTYLALKELNSLILARRARTLSPPRLREIWWALATAVGALLARRASKALTLMLVVKARGLGFEAPRRLSPTLTSLALLGVNCLAVFVGRVVRV